MDITGKHVLILILLIVCCLVIWDKFSNKKTLVINKKDGVVNFKKCDRYMIHDNIKYVFDKEGISRVKNNDMNWDLYLPCGYNYVENEIEDIIIRNKDQKIFAIKGCDKIASKNYLWKILTDEYGFYNASSLMPITYITSNNDHMSKFKQNYASYKDKKISKIYLLKKNIQQKKGILLTKDYNKILKTVKYDKDYKVIQEYIDNLYLVENRKINLRFYVLIICKNNVKKGFLYKNGKCIYSNKSHNIDMNSVTEKELNNDPEIFLTSLNLDPKIYESLPETFDELRTYMGDYYFNTLNSRIINLFKNVIYAIESNICTRSNISSNVSFQLFGADIIFNKELEPYLLEFNKGPAMKYITNKDEMMKKKLTEDIFKKVKIIDGNSDDNFIDLN